MNSIMNTLISIVLLSTIIHSGFGFLGLLGTYRSRVESIKGLSDVPRDKIDWKISVKKVNRTEQVMVGYMLVKEKVGPLELTINLEKWGEGGYKKYLTDGMTTQNVCADRSYRVMMENFNGTLPQDCIFEPGKRYLKPLNIDREMHKHVETTMYGKFRVSLRFSAKGRDVMGLRIIMICDKL